MRGMISLRHIRGEPALKVTVSEPWDFVQEGDPEMIFELTPKPADAQKKRYLKQKRCGAESQNGRECGQALARQSQFRGDVEETSEQQRFDQYGAARGEERQQDRTQTKRAGP